MVPGSDGAGEVVEVGSKVTEFKKGDQVVTLFNQGHQFGDIDIPAKLTGLGGALDGTLRQYAVFNEKGLVKAPNNLTTLESSTLSCAALTSWNSLFGLKPLKPGQYVLVQGTGGVSTFAVQVSPRVAVESSGLQELIAIFYYIVRESGGCGRDCHNLFPAKGDASGENRC